MKYVFEEVQHIGSLIQFKRLIFLNNLFATLWSVQIILINRNIQIPFLSEMHQQLLTLLGYPPSLNEVKMDFLGRKDDSRNHE